ncbi:MAG: hypothetical protein ACYTEL_24205 [Planctomycetota bacterium]
MKKQLIRLFFTITCSVIILLGFFVSSCAVDENLKSSTVRQQFEPIDSEVSDRGANWTALVPAPDRPGAFWVRAHVGIGDTFPVQEKDGRRLFDVVIAEGNDDQLLVEVRCQAGMQRIDLPRDKTVTVEIEGNRYEWYYPSTYVNPDGRTTTDKAFLIIMRLP